MLKNTMDKLNHSKIKARSNFKCITYNCWFRCF